MILSMLSTLSINGPDYRLGGLRAFREQESITIVYEMVRKEGVIVGGSDPIYQGSSPR